MSELKPCPFCGGETHYNPYLNKVWCSNKECEGNSGSWKIAGWNTRPIEDALRAENERLKKALKEIVGNDSPDDTFDCPLAEHYFNVAYKALKEGEE